MMTKDKVVQVKTELSFHPANADDQFANFVVLTHLTVVVNEANSKTVRGATEFFSRETGTACGRKNVICASLLCHLSITSVSL
jgi:hypothetical protein